MKKVLTTIALSLSALVATSAMAAPQHDPRYAPHKPAAHWDHKDAKKWDDRRYNNRVVNPSRDWRVGQKLPNQYDNRRFEVSSYEERRLPKANKNQQWYKINGDYVLVNDRNDKIVRIIN
ncbi:hypothetical protein BS636_05040 [Acinetobacter sp. LoGeW2-3]|uniref:RcnB family protein n=1 Tax=Acinetobacter sp. LoGeW2-3 TaxID=1808001 RepID=UPI000C05B570|nr:RcnB family protein [Acinetobacter sp. LoGeW2-3]ATO19075.1 hypothetical protein BS636_05040 [Acinetobacter sp. LoGeW2-3]